MSEASRSSADAVRRDVARAYTRAVETPAPGTGCCGGGGGSDGAFKGAVVKLAGYTDAEVRALPPDAVENAFGCGNPVAMSEIDAGETVLDLGAGAGIYLLLAARKVGPTGRVIGVDMTDAMLSRAAQNIARAGLDNVEVRKGVIEALPVDDASVDWVISNCVINLSPDKPSVFREIARVLRPGGRMLVSDIVAHDLPEVLRSNAALYSSCVAGAIGEEPYLQGLRDAGLTDVEVRARLVYDAAQLRGFVDSEEGIVESGCCGGGKLPAQVVDGIVAALEGKVRSVKVFARRPRLAQ